MQSPSPRRKYEVVTIYKWNRRKKKFRPHQDIPCSVPRDVEYFEIDGDHFLVIANFQSSSKSADSTDEKQIADSYESKSFIWKYDHDSKTFREFQKITTRGAWDWTYFRILSDDAVPYHFLVVANTISGNEVKLQSQLYYWNKHSTQANGAFVYYQSFMTSGATDFEFFQIGGNSYLAVANSVSSLSANVSLDTRYSTTSVIYKANVDRQQFEIFQEIPTYGILDWEYFAIGNDSYLIGSNQLPGYNMELSVANGNRDTVIYRWQGAEKFVAAHKIQTPPSADWEVIQEGSDTYLIYANGAGTSTGIYKAKLR